MLSLTLAVNVQCTLLYWCSVLFILVVSVTPYISDEYSHLVLSVPLSVLPLMLVISANSFVSDQCFLLRYWSVLSLM